MAKEGTLPLFDLDTLSKIATSKKQEKKNKGNGFDKYSLSLALSLANAQEALSHHPQGPFLMVNSENGQYQEGSRAANGWLALRELQINSRDDLERNGKCFAGIILHTQRAHTLGSQILPYIGNWTDMLGNLATDRAFFTAFIKNPDSEPFPYWITPAMREHMEVLVPNHGSRFDRGKIEIVPSMPKVVILTSSRNIAQTPPATEERQLEVDFSRSFEFPTDLGCRQCGQANLKAQFREGAQKVEVNCPCCSHRYSLSKAAFLQRVGSHLLLP